MLRFPLLRSEPRIGGPLTLLAGLGLCLFSLKLPAAAEPLPEKLTLNLKAAGDFKPGPVVLRFVGPSSVEIHELTLPWQGTLPFTPPARLEVDCHGCWRQALALESGLTEASFEIWPAGRIVGKLAPDSPLPEVLRLHFNPVRLSAFDKPKATPAGMSVCQLETRTFSCETAAAALDLKLEAPGFVPHYFWRREPAPGADLDLGPLTLEKGASIAGWVDLPPAIKPEKVEVRLEITTTGFQGDPVLGTQLRRKEHRATVDTKGFFQFRGIEPGAWTVAAHAPDRPQGPPEMASLRRDEELVLRRPLELPEPGRLRVLIEPTDKAWSFSILRGSKTSHVDTIVASAKPSASGWVEFSALPIGTFSYRIEDQNDGIWQSADFEILPGDNPPLLLQVPLVEVAGKVLLGEDPVPAAIHFGAMGPEQILIQANKDGLFAGHLPRTGQWELAVELAGAGYVRLDPIRIEADSTELELRIPGASLEGSVYEDGRPKSDVVVLVKDQAGQGRLLGNANTDAEGKFRITGLDGGTLGVLAKSTDRQSEWMVVDLPTDSKKKQLRLDLLQSLQVRGRALLQGMPLPAAKIVVLPQPSHLGRSSSLSGVDGSFEVRMPAKSSGATVMGITQGYAAVFRNVPARAGQSILSAGDLVFGEPAGSLELRGLACRPGSDTLLYAGVSLDCFELFAALLAVNQVAETTDTITLLGLPPGEFLFCENKSGICRNTLVTGGETAILNWHSSMEESKN